MDVTRQLTRLFGLTEGGDCIEQVGDEMTGETGYLSFRKRLIVRLTSGERVNVFVKTSDAGRDEMGPYNSLSVWSCARECEFYGLLAPILRRTAGQFGLEFGLPRVHQELSGETGSMLVMEDLVSEGFELAPGVMTREQIRCVLSELANVQTAFWLTQHKLGGGGLVKAFPELARRFDDPARGSPLCFDDMLPDAFEEFSKRFSEFLPDPERCSVITKYLEDPEFMPKAKRILASINDESAEAVGLLHSDLWYNNCMLRDQHKDCRIIDWQFYSIGAFGFDIGCLVISSADNSFAAAEFNDLVEFFYTKVKTTFEEKSETEFPVTLEKTRKLSKASLSLAAVWCVLSGYSLWEQPSVTNILSNMADCISRFQL